jgi:hypothetical protein
MSHHRRRPFFEESRKSHRHEALAQTFTRLNRSDTRRSAAERTAGQRI